MSHSVVTTVTNENYNNQRFILYKHGEEALIPMSEREANGVKQVLDSYPEVFSNTLVVPKEQDEIKLFAVGGPNPGKEKLDFEFQNVEDDCNGITDAVFNVAGGEVTGIDRAYTVKQTFKNE